MKRIFRSKEWQAFLKQAGLKPEENIDYSCGIYEDGALIATGSLHQNIIKCVAVSDDHQGGAAFNRVVSHLMEEIHDRGYQQFYVYTKPLYAQSFSHLGFKELARVDDVLVFMERAVLDLDAYIKRLQMVKRVGQGTAIVMNANPFTLGHQHLVRIASQESDIVYVFVVAEDASDFPNDVRFKLVKKGCEDFENVVVVSTDNYMVSAKTFPSYFIEEDKDITEIQARLDATLFKEKIAPALNITKRYLGEEPMSVATNLYNKALKATLEPQIDVTIIPRKEVEAHPISASKVRQGLLEGDVMDVAKYLPQTTLDYLLSKEGQLWLENYKNRRK